VPQLKKLNSERLNTNESNTSGQQQEEDTYLIVRKQKNSSGEPKGVRLCTIVSMQLPGKSSR
jgi:hypothetical protein